MRSSGIVIGPFLGLLYLMSEHPQNLKTMIYTVGHSNHSIKKFIGLLTANGITAVADVRGSAVATRHCLRQGIAGRKNSLTVEGCAGS